MYKLWIFTTEGLSCLAVEESVEDNGRFTFALAIQGQTLHIAGVDVSTPSEGVIAERRENIWQYDFSSGHLEMTRRVVETPYLASSNSIDPIFQYLLFQSPESVDTELYMVSGNGFEVKLSKFQEGHYQVQPQASLDDRSALYLHRVWGVYNRFFGVGTLQVNPTQPLSQAEIFVSNDLDLNVWTSIGYPGGLKADDYGNISHLSGFCDHIYASVSSRRQGFQLWKIDLKKIAIKRWQLVIERGAFRYSHNCDVLELVSWKGALYAVVGVANYHQVNVDQNDIPSPELIRFYEDDSWDLIVGTPRFSDAGLKIPLAAMGAGFDQPFGAQFQFMLVHEDDLYIALRYQNKIQFWSTQDGETWSISAPEKTADLEDWEVYGAVSTLAGLVLISHPARQPHLVPSSAKASDTEIIGVGNRMAQRKRNSQTSGAIITNLLSSTENLLKHSHQDLFWFTDDLCLHGVLNLGDQEGFSGLVLCSSFDAGNQWTSVAPILGSAPDSTADSYLLGQDLFVVYSCPNGHIALSHFQYDFRVQHWRLIQTSTVFESDDVKCSVPSLVIDGNNAIWCSFIIQSSETAKYGLKVLYSNDGGLSWFDPGITLGTTNASPAKASRLIALKDRVGLIYTNQFVSPEQGVVRTRNWAHRMNNWSIQEAWKSQVLFQHTQAGELREDKFGSHFSAVADSSDSIYFAFQDQGRLMVSKFDYQEQFWQQPIPLTEDSKTTFVRVAVSPERGKVFAVCNVRSFARVFESPLDLSKFEPTQLLLHPASQGLAKYSPRLAAPTVVKDSLPIFQQFKTDDGWGMAAFVVNS